MDTSTQLEYNGKLTSKLIILYKLIFLKTANRPNVYIKIMFCKRITKQSKNHSNIIVMPWHYVSWFAASVLMYYTEHIFINIITRDKSFQAILHLSTPEKNTKLLLMSLWPASHKREMETMTNKRVYNISHISVMFSHAIG